ncbi:MAG: bifunctional phosphoglucose/phosphomannose isomerase [Nanoarchaeota archaeon]|nr:bifunctional phosphoglucose/phosphomannose isomerase [Nanoarchaeota archaeon]MBU1269595.1 bifunctional phosphoglucose/phosphomannose isomerase [Nanoarchaeota archaeon]MBU1603674.1 bifunctional phosphoglucose/phosphomannose isomerase [Nanoarchaeota archaeon]MBU2443853.1 bifunctional phosphoglucose/phosphomannose isomerase [Nanoarchaeota archaeon]
MSANPENKEGLTFPDDFYKYDKSDMKGVLQGFPNQIRQAYKLGGEVNFEGEINKIVITGMGGSAIAADVLKTYLREVSDIPVIINRSYKLPEHCDKETLVIVSSYSGNTEETLSAYKDAIRKFCKIVIITSGGKMADMSKTNRTPIINIQKGMQPRAALAYSFFPMLKLMENLRIMPDKSSEVDRLVQNLEKKVFQEKGLELSEKLVDKIPLIYSSEILSSVAYRWKTQFNENSKIMAFYNVFSELNHNEMAGTMNLNAKFHCIMLRSDLDMHRITKRMDITKDHLRKKLIDVTDIAMKGDTLLTKLFSAIYIGDWTSYYLALRYKTDPTPVEEIETFKKELGTYII